MEKIWIHYFHVTLFLNRAVVQITSVVCAALEEDESNLVEEIPPLSPPKKSFQMGTPDRSTSLVSRRCKMQTPF